MRIIPEHISDAALRDGNLEAWKQALGLADPRDPPKEVPADFVDDDDMDDMEEFEDEDEDEDDVA